MNVYCISYILIPECILTLEKEKTVHFYCYNSNTESIRTAVCCALKLQAGKTPSSIMCLYLGRRSRFAVATLLRA